MNSSLEDSLKSKYWEKFKAIFNSNVSPQLSEIEKLRKKKIAQFFIICILVFIATTLFCLFLASIDDKIETTTGFIVGCIFLIPLCLALTPWICTLVSKSYARKIKNKIANLFAQTFGALNRINSDFNEGKYDALLRKSELVDAFGFIEVDDLYKGNYEGINYTFSDTRFKNIAPRGGEVTIYSGIVLHIKTSKPFLGHTKILENPKDKISSLLFLALILILIFVLGSKLEIDPYMPFLFWKVNCYYLMGFAFILIPVEMLIEHIKTKLKSIDISEKTINKNFTLTSSNKEEAKSFINKGFFAKLFELSKTYHTKSIRCAFFKNNIIIIIGTPKDTFEFGTLFQSAYNTKSYKAYFKEIYPIFRLLHYLKNTSSVTKYLK